ncbi:LptF/LptG family permease [Candidatus Bipolaricaulota bacterium]
MPKGTVQAPGGQPGWSLLRPVRYTRRAMLRRCDRYLLREMIGPFLLALAGLVLFILLNIILSLSDLMVDRGIGMLTLLRLVILKMPSLLVIAVPMSALFATFLGLGRLAHDREIVALESIGIPLRRILLPLIIAASVIGIADFAIYNWGVPASEHAYQQALRSVIFRQGVPRITANAFFRGADNQFFYIRRYDSEAGTLHDVHIYDTTGQLFPHAESRVTMITADTGRWTGDAWRLDSGNVYGFDGDGLLAYSGSFEELTIPLDQSVEQILSRSRTPAEMGIAELVERIGVARRTGQRADELVVEMHLKISLPLATIVFVLVGGTMSLMFTPRSRAVGIVAALLLVAFFQGVLWWTQTLGRRGVMNPVLSAWFPDIVFGLFGLALFIWLDRLASREIWNRIRRFIPFATLVLFLAIPCAGEAVPLDLQSDRLEISEDRKEILAEGNVRLTIEEIELDADLVSLVEDESGAWQLSASGGVRLRFADDLDLSADALDAETILDDGVRLRRVDAAGFAGSTTFVNEHDEEHTIHFRAARGEIVFDDDGEVERIEAEDAALTTCDCCGVGFNRQPYLAEAGRMILYPDRLIVVFDLVGRAGGLPVFWLPVYVWPLDETLESPFFPAIGRSSLRGWFLKWNVPFFLSEAVYGAILFDYYNRYTEIGLGGRLHYDVAGHKGDVSIYRFPAVVGDSVFDFSLDHKLPLGEVWSGEASVDYRVEGQTTELDFAASLRGSTEGWDVSVSASRETEEESADEEEGEDELWVAERIPEISVSHRAIAGEVLTVRPSFELGRYREWTESTPAIEAMRVSGQLQLSTPTQEVLGIRISPRIDLQGTVYQGAEIGQTRGTLRTSVTARRGGVSASYNLTVVQGESPFEFDAEVATHHLGWTIRDEGRATLTISGGISLDTMDLDPVTARLTWTDWADWTFSGEYDLAAASLDALSLAGDWSSEGLRAAWKIPYDPSNGEFETMTLSFDVSQDAYSIDVDLSLLHGQLSATTTLDATYEAEGFDLRAQAEFTDLSLSSIRLSSEVSTGPGWGAKVDWAYDGGALSFDDVRYGLFWDIGGCLRLGVDREASDTWVYLSILAFPEAIVRYAPVTSRIELGD